MEVGRQWHRTDGVDGVIERTADHAEHDDTLAGARDDFENDRTSDQPRAHTHSARRSD